ncbi:MAG: tail fiber domain-containing protein, partial [Candidatus Margulisiibacteriota bacterium]
YWRTSEFPKHGFSKEKQIGFIAQEVEKVLPELVATDKEGNKLLSYEKLTPVLVEAIKELNRNIVSLQAENNTLRTDNKKEIERMKSRLAVLENK